MTLSLSVQQSKINNDIVHETKVLQLGSNNNSDIKEILTLSESERPLAYPEYKTIPLSSSIASQSKRFDQHVLILAYCPRFATHASTREGLEVLVGMSIWS